MNFSYVCVVLLSLPDHFLRDSNGGKDTQLFCYLFNCTLLRLYSFHKFILRKFKLLSFVLRDGERY